jgi:drug/metabolite transporter (DMT)-like permease
LNFDFAPEQERSVVRLAVLFAIAACMVWGGVFVAPALLPEFSPQAIAAGRFIAYGLLSIGLLARDRTGLASLAQRAWRTALAFAFVGNVAYYALVAAALRWAGGTLPTLIIGALPVTIAVAANVGSRELRWARLLPSAAVMAAGLLLVHSARMAEVAGDGATYTWGCIAAVAALLCWTWYGVANARLLRSGQYCASTWNSLVGASTLPFALLIVAFCAVRSGGATELPSSVWLRFIGVCAALGVLAGWVANWLWNKASERLPVTLAGQLVAFETVAGVCYSQVVEGRLPSWQVGVGSLLLVLGVVVAISVQKVGGTTSGAKRSVRVQA